MDSMIREINENLKAIIDNLKETKENSVGVLENIQLQMDKKVEEAKKYKVQVDSAKERIKVLEEENKSLEMSLSELSDKYGKMNLVSIVEAGNKEIKAKINNNLKDINKEKEHIADLTNRARTIKDLLINLKKDKTVKESRLESLNIIYSYYSERVNEIIDFALNHSENLGDFKNVYVSPSIEEDSEEVQNVELENTMVFDEIANIDENKTFKDEMTFIDDQINDALSEDDTKDDEIVPQVEDTTDSTQVFDTIINIDEEDETEEESGEVYNPFEIVDVRENTDIIEEDNDVSSGIVDEVVEDNVLKVDENIDDNINPFLINEEVVEEKEEQVVDSIPELEIEDKFNNFDINLEPGSVSLEENENVEQEIDIENEKRISEINDLFANFNNTIQIHPTEVKEVEDKIDNAYMDIFGKSIDEDELNKKQPTLTDIFGNPISNDELSSETKLTKKIEDIFVENGIDFNRFREDEKNYLKQIYDEEKFNNIFDVLKKNKINLDNIYNAFNIFGEISGSELDSLITKLLNVGQSIEAIGLILEKLPKVKKYNLDDAINGYGEYVKNVDITELIMKAKELYKDGGNN